MCGDVFASGGGVTGLDSVVNQEPDTDSQQQGKELCQPVFSQQLFHLRSLFGSSVPPA